MEHSRKIVLVGPVYPYKGGISHYTSLMCAALRKQNQVYMMSYKFQYPKFLYKKEQKDFGNDAFRVEDTDYAIHTASPFNWVSAARKIRRLKPDLVIFQWWHPYFAPCYFAMSRLLGKIKTLYVCHNVFPHERFPLDRFLTKMVLGKGDCFIVQSSQDEEDLLSIRPGARYKKTVHPTYNAFRLQGLSREEGRRQLKLSADEKVILFFGFVREYKGLKHLLRAMPAISGSMEKARLLVVGDFPGNREEYTKLIEELGIEDAVDIYDGYIPDREVEKFFAAADLVALPYESATQSGIVQIAYGFEKPVVVTNVGGLPEVVREGETGYVVEAGDSAALGEKIIEYFREGKQEAFREAIRAEAERYSWDRMAETVDELSL